MTIEIKSLTNVLVDGQPQGGVVDVLFNSAAAGNEAIRAPMLDALNDLYATKDAATEATLARMKEDNEAEIARLNDEHEAALTSQKIASDIALQETQNAAAAELAAAQDAASKNAVTMQAVFDLKLARADKALSDSQARAAAELDKSEQTRIVMGENYERELADSRAKAVADFDAQKAISDDAIGALKDALAREKAESAARLATINELNARQASLAGQGLSVSQEVETAFAALGATLGKVKAIVADAHKGLDEKKAEEKRAELDNLRALLARKEAEIA